MTTNETIPALLPCPFCGDPMQVRHGTIRNQEPRDCIVESLAFDASWADRVNRRATRPSSEALQRARESEAFWKETAATESRARIEAESALSTALKQGEAEGLRKAAEVADEFAESYHQTMQEYPTARKVLGAAHATARACASAIRTLLPDEEKPGSGEAAER